MEPPAVFNARALRDEKVKVLQSLREPAPDDLVLGQYEGYRDEAEVADDSQTPTYAALRLYVDNWRWQDVPFYLRSGKGLSDKLTEITLQFKRAPHLMFPEKEDLSRNHLSLCIHPQEGVHLNFATKVPGAGMHMDAVDMEFSYANQFDETPLPEAYERLLLDALQGDTSLFTRGDEIELAWKLIDPMTKVDHPTIYPVGSWGPEGAEALIEDQACDWHYGCADIE
jgi:glucose-6-phosphate 1-dehydrogenase